MSAVSLSLHVALAVFLCNGQGWSGGPMHDATAFVAKTNTVVVTANYRLGALGTLILDGDAQDAADGGPSHDDDEIPFGLGGNLGIEDQRYVHCFVVSSFFFLLLTCFSCSGLHCGTGWC